MNLLHHMKNRLIKVLVTTIIALVLVQYWFRTAFDEHRLEPLFVINATRARLLATGGVSANMTNDTATMVGQEEPSVSVTDSTLTQNNSNSTAAPDTRTLVNCPPVPPHLVGPIPVLKDYVPLEEVEKTLPVAQQLDPGGCFHPTECKSQNRVALVVPYRSRPEQLSIFLNNLHRVLSKQQLDYQILIVEQDGDEPFNRGKLMNIGFVEALKLRDFDCFVFHDVDLLPEDDRNLYTCPEQPRHMSVAVDKFKYKLPYKEIFGGVSALSKAHFIQVNGFSNSFWGWGGEDDDMYSRIRKAGLHIARYPPTTARYTMLQHNKQKPNPKRFEILHQGKKRYSTEGLNSLKYQRKALQLYKLYTWILADLQPPS